LARCVERNRARQFDARSWTFPLGNEVASPDGPQVSTCLGCGVDVLTDKDEAYRALAEVFVKQFPKGAIVTSRSEIKNALNVHRPTMAESAYVQPDAICLVCHGYINMARADQSGLLLAGRRGEIFMRNVHVHGAPMKVNDLPFAEVPLRLEPVQPRSAAQGSEYRLDSAVLERLIFDPEVMTTSELRVYCETDAQLVALFGCSTGTGTVTSSDDYVSHAYQWLKAGAASVIANLWEADFPIITDWAQRFAVNWVQRRQPKALAAREATRGLLADRPELAGQPALWGSVSLLGDWL
jgi:CHAT domain-containing protein